MKARKTLARGFTLIELVAVMVVLAVLAGVAVPKYLDYADRAKSSALEGTLGGVRAGVANFFTDQMVEGEARYPTHEELTDVGVVMQEAIPKNPYNELSEIAEITSLANAQNRQVAATDQYGWNYYVDNDADPPISIFWANSDDETKVEDSDGTMKQANEL